MSTGAIIISIFVILMLSLIIRNIYLDKIDKKKSIEELESEMFSEISEIKANVVNKDSYFEVKGGINNPKHIDKYIIAFAIAGGKNKEFEVLPEDFEKINIGDFGNLIIQTNRYYGEEKTLISQNECFVGFDKEE